MRLYHRTPAGRQILSGGFRDADGSYMFVGIELTGVWLSSEPANSNDGAKGDDLLEVTFPDDVDMSEYQIVEEDPGGHVWASWEWCVPAALINGQATVRLMTEEEESELAAARFEARLADDPELAAQVAKLQGDDHDAK